MLLSKRPATAVQDHRGGRLLRQVLGLQVLYLRPGVSDETRREEETCLLLLFLGKFGGEEERALLLLLPFR